VKKHFVRRLAGRNRWLFTALLMVAMSVLCSSLVFAQTFTSTGNLTTGRNGHRAIALKNGMVLIAGGYDINENALGSAELYDPITGTFTITGSLNVPRRNFAIALLDDGTVLVTGGYDANFSALASAEIYDPATGVFTLTGNLNVARGDATATRLSDGTVLIAGGFSTLYVALSSAEIYAPSRETFAMTGSLNAVRGFATATALMDGTVLIAGGWDANGALASAEVYDPAAASFKTTGNMNQARVRHTATMLNGGNVLIVGGEDSASNILSGAEIYSPSTARFTPTGSLNTSRGDHVATLLTNGTVLVEGGFACDPSNCTSSVVDMSASAEIYDPASGSFGITGKLTIARQVQSATLLSNGMVLVAGGFTDGNPALTSAELFQPASFTPTNLASITISPVNRSLLVGGIQALAAIGTFSDNSTLQLASVIWSSSDTSVATVTNDSGSNSGITNDSTNSGVVLGMAPGTAILTACAGTVCGSTTVAVGLPGGSQGFSLGGSPGSLTVAPGQTATFSVVLAPRNGFNQTVTLSCGALPLGVGCSLYPSILGVRPASNATTTVTITTTGSSSATFVSSKRGGVLWPQSGESSSWLPALEALATCFSLSLGLCFFPRRRCGMMRHGVVTVFLLTQIIACGCTISAPTSGSVTPRGTYTITVTGKSAGISTTTQMNLVVN
jgi:Bacterial Ig-like domain (group 2)/Kelch motif